MPAWTTLAPLWTGATAGPLTVSRRDLFNAYKNTRFKTVTELDPVLTLLQQHGWLRPTGIGSPGRGNGKKSPTYQLHPDLRLA